MARAKCSNCGVLLAVPNGAQIFRCPVCKATIGYSNNNGYRLPSATQHAYTNNNYYPPRISYNRPRNNYNPAAALGAANYRMPRPPPQVPPPPMHGRKRAVLIGINYLGQPSSLKGSINDAKSMSNLLVHRLGFPEESVLVLTDEEMDPYRMPTKRNILTAMRWLVLGCQPGDSLVFHYSGHSTQIPDEDGDEADGFDESLCPVDYLTEGTILDDEINNTIVRPLPPGVKLHAIIDTSFSGTFLDLPFKCNMNNQGSYTWEDHRISDNYKGTSGGTAICFSACDDDETSGDTMALTGDTIIGAMTYSFIQAVENERRATYGSLLQAIRNKVAEAQKRPSGPYASPALQVPQLSSSETFAIHSRPFML